MIRYFSNIPVRIDYKTVFSLLGYKKRSTDLPESFRKKVEEWIELAGSTIVLEAAAAVCRIKHGDNGRIDFSEESFSAGKEQPVEFSVTSLSLQKFLSGSEKILAMGITGGNGVMKLIETCQQDDLTKAVVLDAAAGEIVDSGLDYVVSLFNRELARQSARLMTKRFSPGYGDLAIEAQADFHRLLHLDKLGVSLTDSFMLVPQKSVIALTGIV